MFYDTGSFNEQKISMSHFKEWAHSAADEYMSSGEKPTEFLCKVAQQEGLGDARLAQERKALVALVAQRGADEVALGGDDGDVAPEDVAHNVADLFVGKHRVVPVPIRLGRVHVDGVAVGGVRVVEEAAPEALVRHWAAREEEEGDFVGLKGRRRRRRRRRRRCCCCR